MLGFFISSVILNFFENYFDLKFFWNLGSEFVDFLILYDGLLFDVCRCGEGR